MKKNQNLKQRKHRWQLLIIIIASVLAGTSVFVYTAGINSKAQQNQKLVDVYMAQKQIAIGTSFESAIRDGYLSVKGFPAGSLPLGSIVGINPANASLVAKQTIQPGQIIVTGLFADHASNTGALMIPEGMLAVTVAMSDPAKVANFLQPGSEIAIFATGFLQSSSNESTQVLLPRITVLAIGDQVLMDEQPSSAPSLVTVAVTPTEAKKLIYASKNLTLYFGLRTDGVNINGTPAITNNNLFTDKN